MSIHVIVHMSMHIHVCAHLSMHTYVCRCAYLCTALHTSLQMSVYMSVCMPIMCRYTWPYTCLCTRLRTRLCTCLYTCLCISLVNAHTCTHGNSALSSRCTQICNGCSWYNNLTKVQLQGGPNICSHLVQIFAHFVQINFGRICTYQRWPMMFDDRSGISKLLDHVKNPAL